MVRASVSFGVRPPISMTLTLLPHLPVRMLTPRHLLDHAHPQRARNSVTCHAQDPCSMKTTFKPDRLLPHRHEVAQNIFKKMRSGLCCLLVVLQCWTLRLLPPFVFFSRNVFFCDFPIACHFQRFSHAVSISDRSLDSVRVSPVPCCCAMVFCPNVPKLSHTTVSAMNGG